MTSKWEKYVVSPKTDKWSKYQITEKEPEGFLKSSARTALQIPKGMAQVTAPGMAANIWDLLSSGEALAELPQWEEGREQELRRKFPQAPWPKEKVFDKQKYLESLEAAKQTIPTVENISKFLESQTGLPLEAKTKLQKIVEMGSGFFKKPISGVIPSKANKELYNFGKAMGMTEKEITPLMQSERKIKWLSKLSQKGSKANEALKGTHEALGEVYKSIIESNIAKKSLNPTQANKFANSIRKLTSTMPVHVREAIQKDAFELANNGFKGSELANFWKDITKQIYENGYNELGVLKGPIGEALKDINPKLGEDFININKLYGKYFNIRNAMKPSMLTELETAGKSYELLKNLLTLNFRALGGLGLYQGAKSFAREALINPKFQNLTKKLVSSLNNYRYGSANLVFNQMKKIIKNDSPELANELENIDFENLKSSINERKD